MLIQGACHCRNITFTLRWEPDPTEFPARACDCSFCMKHGGVWTSYPAGVLEVIVQDAAQVSAYSHGTRTAEFQVCGTCGVCPVVTSRIDETLYAVVSVNAFENVDAGMVRRSATSFDGEQADDRLARRKRNWIGSVVVRIQ